MVDEEIDVDALLAKLMGLPDDPEAKRLGQRIRGLSRLPLHEGENARRVIHAMIDKIDAVLRERVA